MPNSQVERLTGLMDLLLSTQVNIRYLAMRYDTTRRTIYRDLEVLRDLGYPLHTSDDGTVGPDRAALGAAARILVTPPILSALFAALRQAERSRPHSTAASKLASVLAASEMTPVARVWRQVADGTTNRPVTDAAILHALMEAASAQSYCRVEYRAMTDDSYRPVRFAPQEILPGPPPRVSGWMENEQRRSLLELSRIRRATILTVRTGRAAGVPRPDPPPGRRRARAEDLVLKFLTMTQKGEEASEHNLAELASMFQCAENTVKRNLDALGASGFGYMLVREGRGRTPPVLFTQSEQSAILSAVRRCKPDHPLAAELEQAELQLTEVGKAAHLIIELKPAATPSTGPFWVLVEAILARRCCWIKYIGHFGGETREFTFEPKELELDELVRVSGYLVGNPEPKCLTVGRIARAHLTGTGAAAMMEGVAQPFDYRDAYAARTRESESVQPGSRRGRTRPGFCEG
jgi:predicted DNA-binding transcriptional regulator YafY